MWMDDTPMAQGNLLWPHPGAIICCNATATYVEIFLLLFFVSPLTFIFRSYTRALYFIWK